MTRKHYDDMKQAFQAVIEQQRCTIEAKDQIIEAYKREVAGLEARINYHKAKAEKRGQKPNPWRKPSELASEDTRPKLTDPDDPRNYDRDDHDPFPEE